MHRPIVWGVLGLVLGGGIALSASALAREAAEAGESERVVQPSEVPPQALAALERLAGQATIEELAQEVEHGRTFYEGSWNGPAGRTDALVTPAGDVVELEEMIPAGSVPAAVTTELQRAASDASFTVERKTVYLYEGHFDRHGKEQEVLLTPDGRRYLEPKGH